MLYKTHSRGHRASVCPLSCKVTFWLWLHYSVSAKATGSPGNWAFLFFPWSKQTKQEEINSRGHSNLHFIVSHTNHYCYLWAGQRNAKVWVVQSLRGVNADAIQRKHGHDRGSSNLRAHCQRLTLELCTCCQNVLSTHTYTSKIYSGKHMEPQKTVWLSFIFKIINRCALQNDDNIIGQTQISKCI